MKKSTIAATGGAGLLVLALASVMAGQKSADNHEILAALQVDMGSAAAIASQAGQGIIFDVELELDDALPVWEIELMDEANNVVRFDIDGVTGDILSTRTDGRATLDMTDAIAISKAIELVTAVERGALTEAELEQEDGELVWEFEALGEHNKDIEIKLHGLSGDIIN